MQECLTEEVSTSSVQCLLVLQACGRTTFTPSMLLRRRVVLAVLEVLAVTRSGAGQPLQDDKQWS